MANGHTSITQRCLATAGFAICSVGFAFSVMFGTNPLAEMGKESLNIAPLTLNATAIAQQR